MEIVGVGGGMAEEQTNREPMFSRLRSCVSNLSIIFGCFLCPYSIFIEPEVQTANLWSPLYLH
jgi:hypothetical protein